MPLRVTWLLLCLWLAATAVLAQATDPDPAAQRAKGLTQVEVTVVDERGNKLPNITVTGAHQGIVFERDIDYKSITNADGVATLWVQTSRYGTERALGTTIWLEAVEIAEDKSYRLRNTKQAIKLNHRQAQSRATILMLPTQASNDPVHGVALRVKAIDQDGNPVPGALITVQTSDMQRSVERLADSDGVLLTEATVMSDRTSVTVTASKADYNSGSARFTLSSQQRRTGNVTERNIKLVRQGAAEVKSRVRVTVLSDKDSQPLSDAYVRLTPLAPTTGIPGADVTSSTGVAVLPGGLPGSWALEVKHSLFETYTDTIEQTGVDLPMTVRLRQRLSVSEDSSVEVTVLAVGSATPLRPIPGARIRWGNTSTATQADGKVKIGFNGQTGVDLVIEAEGYDPQTISLPAGRYVTSNHIRTVRLLPKGAAADEDSRVEVTVLAADQKRRDGTLEPIAGARIQRNGAVAPTDAQGKAKVDYSGLVGAEWRIEAEGYQPGTLRIAGGPNLLPNQKREVRLQPITEAPADDSELQLTVLSDAVLPAGRRASPIAGARVIRGATSQQTDSGGKATLSFVGQSGLELRVEADGFRPGTLTLPSSRVARGSPTATHVRELRLKPDLPDETTPIQLRLRITEAGNAQAVAGARVRLTSPAGRAIGSFGSDGGGLAGQRLDDAATTAARGGVGYEVEAKGYQTATGSIAAHRLLPSRDAVEEAVSLDPLLPVTIGVVERARQDKPVVGAGVQLFAGAQPLQRLPVATDNNGRVTLDVIGPVVRSVQRDGLFVEVKEGRFIDHRSTINAPLLAGAAPLYLVQMDPLSDNLLPALAAEVARLEAMRKAILAEGQTYLGLLQTVQAAIKAADLQQQRWDGSPEGRLGQASLGDLGWVSSSPELCGRGIKGVEQISREYSGWAQGVITSLQHGRDLAEICQRSPAANAVTMIEYHEAQANTGLKVLRETLLREQTSLAKLNRDAAAMAQALKAPGMVALKKAVADAERAAEAVSTAGEALLKRQADLASGKLSVSGKLDKLRTLLRTPQEIAQAQPLKTRIDALTLPDWNVAITSSQAPVDAQTPAASLQRSLDKLQRVEEPACKKLRDDYRLAVDAMDTEFFAADAAVRVNNLKGRAADCKTSWEAANSKPTLVAVPNLQGLPPGAMANTVRNAGLTWGGPAAAGIAPAPGLGGQLAKQEPVAFSMVAPNTPVIAYIWQDPPQPPPPPPPPVVPVVPPPPPAERLARVPALGGLSSKLAIDTAIIFSGLVPAYQTVVAVPTGMEGRFAGQYPDPGTLVPFGSAVRYGIYATAAPPQTYPLPPVAPPPVATSGGIPSVYGDSLERAQGKLEAVGMRVGGITKGASPPSAEWAGRVYYQDPAAGSPIRRGGGVALHQYGPMSSTVTAPPMVNPPPPTVPGPVGTGQPNCATNEGPIGCTGTFAGNVYLACDGGVAPGNYASNFTLRANGSAELQIPSPGNQPYTIVGTMDRSGRVQVDRQDDGVRHRWVGQFSRVAAGAGGRLSGSGTYEATINIVDVRMKRCTGQFTLK